MAASAALGTQKAGGHNARLVGNDQVAGLQVVDDVTENLVVQGTVFALHNQHAATVALGGGLLGNQFLGQVVVEIIGTHVHQLFSFLFRLGGFAGGLSLGTLGGSLGIGIGAAAVILAVHAKLAAADGCLGVELAEILEHGGKFGVGCGGAFQFFGDGAYILVRAYGKRGANALVPVLVRVAGKLFQAQAVARAAPVVPVFLRAVPCAAHGLLPAGGLVGPFYHGDALALRPGKQRLKAMLVFGGGGYVGIEVGDGYVVARFGKYPHRLQRAGPAAGVK